MTAAVVESLYERLAAAASLDSEDAGLRVFAEYQPGGGEGTKVHPPSYPLRRDQQERRSDSLYLTERRYVEGSLVDTVLLDATQSQSNRCELGLQDAIDRGDVALPLLVLQAQVGEQPVRVTSLQAPHRSRDAYFRDSVLEGSDPPVRFDDSAPGRSLVAAREDAALAYYRHAPTDLVYGSWDSHRGRSRAVRFPRVYTSEIIGLEPVAGYHGAGRMDPSVLGGKDKVAVPKHDPAGWSYDRGGATQLTRLGHGVIPPSLNDDPRKRREAGAPPLAGGGVAVRSVRRQAYLNFAGLAQLRLGAPGEPAAPAAERAGRAVLAALALLGDRLAFDRPALFLRSGCELLLLREQMTFARRGGETDEVTIGLDTARSVFDHAVERAARAGLDWETEPVLLAPGPNLLEALHRALVEVDVDAVED